MIESVKARARALPFSLWLLALVWLVQGVIWAQIIHARWNSWSESLNFWDSSWYTDIILNGYKGPNYAFYPLYPLVVGSLTRIVGTLAEPAVIGTFFSSTLFLLTILWLQNSSQREDLRSMFLVPSTRWGWFFFLCSPASYVFHSHHTEALFLCLSLAAFVAQFKSHWIKASLLAGLCALTKNQGIFVAITIGFWAASNTPGTLLQKASVFVRSGLISGSLFALYPLYCYLSSGDAMSFYSAQLFWRPEMTSGSYVKALLLANPWQNTNMGSIYRYGLFWILLLLSFTLLSRRNWLGLYCLLFVGVMPMSGEFVGTFRYATVLFPLWFLCGDLVAKHLASKRPVFAYILASLFLALNILTTQSYALRRWAY